jgi:hypothetical protein
MGWVNSPPLFDAATETITDNTNAALARHEILGPHRLKALADPDPPENRRTLPARGASEPSPRRRPPLQYTDVYFDDFVMAAQGSHAKLRRHRQTLFHEIDKVLLLLEPTDSPHRTEPTSVKKLGKGDTQWSTRKNILGWIVDTVRHTIELPPPPTRPTTRHPRRATPNAAPIFREEVAQGHGRAPEQGARRAGPTRHVQPPP